MTILWETLEENNFEKHRSQSKEETRYAAIILCFLLNLSTHQGESSVEFVMRTGGDAFS